MPGNKSAPAATVLVLLATLALVTGCSEEGPEQQIRNNIAALQTALEGKDSDTALTYVAAEFLGNRTIDKPALRRLLLLHFLRHQKIEIVMTQLEVTPNPTDPLRASMSGAALLVGMENLLPESGRLHRFNGDWLLVNEDWRLTHLHWQ